MISHFDFLAMVNLFGLSLEEFSCEIFKIFKNTHFEEKLQTDSSETQNLTINLCVSNVVYKSLEACDLI